MRRAILPSLLGLLLVVAAVRSDGAIPVDTLKQLKAATVFVKVEFAAPGVARGRPASGTGFLMKVDGETGLIVTNHHVISPPTPRFNLVGSPTLVFWSGTKQERSVFAEIVASDPDRDLAILRVSKFKDLPQPIDLAQKTELIETMQVYMFGFPFGEALSLTKGNPAMTVSKGSVSSIREDEFGNVKFVQIDGDLNPGNSGGPVVDGQGRLVGVAVARIRNTKIGMAIPPAELSKMLLGRVGSINITSKKVENGTAEVAVEARLIDPLKEIKSVAIQYVRADALKAPLKADKEGRWPVLPDSQKLALKVDGARASAMLKVAAEEKKRVRFSFQTAYVNGEGKTIYTQPGTFEIDFGKVLTAVEPKPVKPGEVQKPDQPAGGDARLVGDLKVTDVKVDVKEMVGNLCWSAEGRKFFCVTRSGLVRRFALDGFKEEQRLDIGRKCSWLNLSAEGLVLSMPDLQEVWVVDTDSFKVKAKTPVPSVMRAVSAPAVSYAVAANHQGNGLYLLDLRTGGVLKEYTPQQFGNLVGFGGPVLTPDGKYLFTKGGIEQLFRFHVNEKGINYEESGPRIAQGRLIGINVSPDSKYVCLPSGGGNYQGLRDHPQLGAYGTYIYPVTDLTKPEFTLSQGAYPMVVGFDPKAGLVYSQNFDKQLIVFSAAGIKQKEYKVGAGEPRQYLVHPEGRKLLLLTSERLYFVELPKP